MAKVIYAAVPKRLAYCLSEIKKRIIDEGFFPLITLYAFPREDEEHYARFKSEIKRITNDMVEKCDELWIFGIGRGSLKDYEHAKSIGKPVRSLLKDFDMEWEIKSTHERYKDYRHIVEQVIGKSELERLLVEKERYDRNGTELNKELPERFTNIPFIYG
mgnify:CR=1 FL=1